MLMLLPMNDVVSSISSQIVEQIEAIPEAVLSKVSKLIDSVMSKKKGLHKIEMKMNSLLTNTQKYVTN